MYDQEKFNDLFEEGIKLAGDFSGLLQHNLVEAYRPHKEGSWTCKHIIELRAYLDKLETAVNDDAKAWREEMLKDCE